MQQIHLTEDLFKGAISLEVTDEYMKPWRIPFKQADLFVPNHINGKAEIPAGVRITLCSNTGAIQVDVVPSEDEVGMDCVINGALFQTGMIQPGESSLVFDALPEQDKKIEIYLSQRVPVRVSGLWIDEKAGYHLPDDESLRWIAYGSSITQCAHSATPAQTWSALVAQKEGLDLTCLGYGGNCHLEPMVARMIRDTPADMISLCVGINVMGGSTLSERTFASALIGFIQLIREKQPEVPMVVTSPIFCRHREATENAVGFTLVKIRKEVEKVIKILQKNGDRHLYYINGLDVFDEQYEQHLSDGTHPDQEGNYIICDRFSKLIKPLIPFHGK